MNNTSDPDDTTDDTHGAEEHAEDQDVSQVPSDEFGGPATRPLDPRQESSEASLPQDRRVAEPADSDPPLPRSQTPLPANLDPTSPLGSVLFEEGIAQRNIESDRDDDIDPQSLLPGDFGAISRSLPSDGPSATSTDPVFAPRKPAPGSDPRTTATHDARSTRRDPPSRLALLVLALVASILGATLMLGGIWAFGGFDNPTPAVVTTTSQAPTASASPLVVATPSSGPAVESDPVRVGNQVVPSIVRIEVGTIVDGILDPFASGSGVVIASDGVIVTNNHVVRNAQDVQVIFDDGRIFNATIVGTDEITDLAVLQINATGLTPIQIGLTSELSIGSEAIVIGSPLRLSGGPSLTVGVISAFDRQVNTESSTLFGMLQTDAAINPGSSGGALVNGDGQLIGIVTAIAVSAAGPEGIGFATPVEVVVRITNEIRQTGDVRHAFLGINGISELSEQTDGSILPIGARVAELVAGGAAELAGVEVNDIIISVDGTPRSTMDALISGLRLYVVGDEISLLVLRDGEELSISVVLGERPENP